MMPASKHGDPQLGVDIHLCVVPPSPSPVPLPTPHLSVVFDPFDYVPILGATITVCGMKRATAGTSGIAVHIPPGFPFAPMLPQKDDELFMGSATVVADGDPFSYIALPVLSCQIAGMPSIPRLRKKGPKKMMLAPLVFNLAIPTNVFVGGPPTISLMGMAMKGAFAGLGKIAKSGVFKRMRQKLFKNMKPGFLKCTILRAEPVNILSGAVSVEHEDFVLPGRIPIEWRRVYGSDNRHAGQCGYGWETPADGRLEINHDGVLMHYPEVGPLSFNGVPVAEGEAAAELELQDGAVLTDVDGEYRVRTKEDRIYHFPKRWLVRRPEGGQSIALSKIADLCGNHLQFERHGGVLAAIHESAGRCLEFRTDAGRILTISLVTPESPERHVYVHYDYDAAGDLVAVRDALDHPYTFAYDAHHMVRHTDRNGLSFYYEYQDDWRVVHAWGDGGLYDYRFEYADALRERRITDSLGHVSTVKLNEQELPINEIDALDGMTIYEYDDAGRTIGVTDQDGRRTAYEYDERGNLLKTLRPDGSTVQTRFDALNKPIEIIDANAAIWQQALDARGLLVSQATPCGHASHYEYDANGQLIVFVNPRGGHTEFRYDVYGNLVRILDAMGQRSRFAYDVLGNATGKQDAAGRKTLYNYDAMSRLTAVQLPSGSQVRCRYDAEGNLIEYIDERGASLQLEYFGQGQLAKRIQPDCGIVEYQYDTEERLSGVRNQRGELHRFKRDPLGRIIQEIDYWGQVSCYEYSAAGDIRASVDPLNQTITYATDQVGRIVSKWAPDPHESGAQLEERFEYDANGNLLAAENAHLRIERSFDPEGHLLQEKQGDAFTIQSFYDEAGNRTARHTCFVDEGTRTEHLVRYSYDALNRATEVHVDDHPPIRLERNAVGEIVHELLGARLQRATAYDVDGAVTRRRVHAGAGDVFDVGYEYDAAGNLTTRRDSVFGIDQFTYDPMGRITQHLDPQGKLAHYLSDPVGDRLQTHIAQPGTQHQQGAIAGSSPDWFREGTCDGGLYRFNRAGNLIQRADVRGELHLVWDANQRLIETRCNGNCTQYRYDPLGRRIDKRAGNTLTAFTWDGDTLVAAGSKVGGLACTVEEWLYFPETFEPLAVLDGGAVLYHHNDPNGCPVRLTDGEGEVLWAASYTVWGAVAHLDVAGVDQPLRLQGQYADPETGLHYNRHRYYAPELGQFISADPLRLIAGPNTYRFAPNALGWIDPLGLVCLDRRVGRFRDPATGRFVSGTQVRGHFPQTVTPPQRVLFRADATGQVTHFQHYDAAGLPLKRVDITGAAHGGVPTPHVVEFRHDVHPRTGQIFPAQNRMVRPAGPQDLI